MYKTLEFKILEIESFPNPQFKDDPNVYKSREKIVAETQGGQWITLTRFRHCADAPLARGFIYRATVKPAKKENHNDEIINIRPIDTWGGQEQMDFPIEENLEQNEKEASILAQSDIRTAATIIASIVRNYDKTPAPDEIENLLLSTCKIIKKVREKITREYKEEQ